MNKIIKNKKGAIGIIIFFMILFAILVLGFIAAMAVGIIDFASDTITPVMQELGVAGNSNLSEAAEYSFVPLNTFVQALPWVVGLSYVVALLFSIIFVLSYNYNPHPAFIGFYFALVILLIFGSIIMSNMYQDIYSADDEIAERLKEQTLLSYMILYSPFILTLIALITGIYLFAGPKGEGGGYGL